MSVHMHMCAILTEPRRGHWFPLKRSYRQLETLGMEPHPLEEQPVLLTTKPSPQPLMCQVSVQQSWMGSHKAQAGPEFLTLTSAGLTRACLHVWVQWSE